MAKNELDDTQLDVAVKHLKHALDCLHLFDMIDGETEACCVDCQEARDFIDKYNKEHGIEEEEDNDDGEWEWWIAFGG